MVGRMGGKSVVTRAEKGKVGMRFGGEDRSGEKKLAYDAGKDIDHEDDNLARVAVFRPAIKIMTVRMNDELSSAVSSLLQQVMPNAATTLKQHRCRYPVFN